MAKATGLPRTFRILLLCAAAAAPLSSRAGATPELLAVEFGQAAGIERTTLARVGFLWGWGADLLQGSSWRLRGSWELSLGAWQGDKTLVDAGLTPIFRWEAKSAGLLGAPYLEAAVGAHLLSGVSMFDRGFSTAFQFGDHVGLGTRFGRFDLSYKLQHLSNGGIKSPNDGILFNIVRFGCAF
ncbi:MAG: acyloxyacyl hydrolase [Deltaproteobacteria bacterium]|nr:acyloxyacyl hydrolase [Deltaproteobacteria bacterium]